MAFLRWCSLGCVLIMIGAIMLPFAIIIFAVYAILLMGALIA